MARAYSQLSARSCYVGGGVLSVAALQYASNNPVRCDLAQSRPRAMEKKKAFKSSKREYRKYMKRLRKKVTILKQERDILKNRSGPQPVCAR